MKLSTRLFIFMFSASPLFSAAAASASSSQVNMCSTDPQHPSSHMIRTWTFEMLKRSGYSDPEAIMLHNCSSSEGQHPAGAHAGEKKIYFNEAHFQKYSLGFKLATIGHEVVHIKYGHTMGNRETERLADKKGLLLTACEQCGVEVANHYDQRQEKQTKDYLFVFRHSRMPKSILEFKLLTPSFQRYFIDVARSASESARSYNTHPCDLERAFYLYQHSQLPELKGKMCLFHHDEKKQKRKKVVRAIVQKAQELKKVAGTKRKRENELEPVE